MFRWLGSETGRLVLQGAAFASGVAAFGVCHLPHSVYIDKYKEFVQSYEKGMEQPVKPKVQKLYEQVLDDAKVPERDRKLLRIFTVFGFDMFHAGSTVLITGAIIGIPVNFSYDTEDDVNRKIQVVQKPVEWASEVGKELQKSLVLSEDARRFAIAREINRTNNVEVWINSLSPALTITFAYILARSLNDRLKTRKNPSRFIMYTLVSSFAFAIYCTLADISNLYFETASDESAASIGPAYGQGGLEFYRKLQQRNKALRQLMGEEGKALYTTTGNEQNMIRIRTTPLHERIGHLEEFLEEKKVKDEQEKAAA